MPIIESIVSQHAEEAAFLWLLRDLAVAAPHYSLQDLADLDERVEAHIDGLRVAGVAGWAFCAEGLKQRESGEVFAAAVIALEGNHFEHIQEVYRTVAAAPETASALIAALGWISRDRLQGKIAGLLYSDSPLWRRIGIGACAAHRVDCGDHLVQALDDPDPTLRARALRAAGEVGRVDLLSAIQRQFGSEHEESTFWAAWSAVLLGDRGAAVGALTRVAVAAQSRAQPALDCVVRVLSAQDAQRLLKGLASHPERLRDLIVATGAIGDPVYLPWLINQMRSAPELARVAGEAFSTITGVDLAYQDLEAEPPADFEAGPTDRPEDDDVAMDPDEDLAWPEPTRLQAWWDAHAARFQPGTRNLLGAPISATHCRDVLRTGLQRQRKAAALELALMQADAPLFETRAPARRQQALLRADGGDPSTPG